MDDDFLQRLADERACEALIVRYTHLVDFREAPAIADLFTQDGTWRTADFVMDGRDGIRAGFERRQGVTRRQSRHVCTNIAITIDGDEATGLCYLVNFRHDSPTGQAEKPAPAGLPKFVGEYHDRFVRTNDGWLFADRFCDMAFVRQSETAAAGA